MRPLFALLLATLLTLLPPSRGTAAALSLPDSTQQSARGTSVRIGMHSGAGYGMWRDLGASPRSYHGIELRPGLTVAVDLPRWRFHAASAFTVGAYGWHGASLNVDCFGGQSVSAIEAWRLCLARHRWELWGGAALGNTADLRYSRLLGNAAVGVSDFATLSLAARAEYRLPHWQFHGGLTFTPAALTLRPGYAYIANYDRDIHNPVANTFEQYHWYLVGACGLATDIGVTLLLPNGNRIGVSYLWHHLTSRTAAEAPHRFDQASHTLSLSLEFSLSRPQPNTPAL